MRHGLIDPQVRKRKRSDYKRWERSRAMELWQLDITGGVALADGTRLQLLTGLDDHSRFCVAAKVLVRPTARPVCRAFADAMRAHGVPEQVLTDNGKVFTGRFGKGTGEVLFDRICRDNGIRHLLTAPRSPTTTGKVERFHKTLKREFLDGKTFRSSSPMERPRTFTEPEVGVTKPSRARKVVLFARSVGAEEAGHGARLDGEGQVVDAVISPKRLVRCPTAMTVLVGLAFVRPS